MPRERLYKLLDTNHHVQFISAPAGAGKTTLVSSYIHFRKYPFVWYRIDSGDSDLPTFFYYLSKAVQKAAPMEKPLPSLTPEYIANIPIFTRRFFESLYGRLNSHSVIVFDNYQEVHVDCSLHEILKSALDVIPDGIKVIIISRSVPPRQFIRLQANTEMNVTEWETISFTMKETKDFVERIKPDSLTNKELHQLYNKTNGWPVGIILYLQGAKLDGMQGLSLDIDTPEAIFNYFALEVFYKLDEETTDFLLKTAYLSKMTPDKVKELTGFVRSKSLLAYLNSINCFTERRLSNSPIYQYHPLFREFLLLQSKEKYTSSEISQIQHRCADILEKYNEIEEAAGLFNEAKNWDRLLPLILSQAKILASQGRTKVLEEWIKRLPIDMVNANPWLMYWLGICQVSFSPEKSEKQFGKSFKQFHACGNAQGAFLAWAGAVESILLSYADFKQLDKWFNTFDELMGKYGKIPAGEIEIRVVTIMINSLELRKPNHPVFGKWIKLANKIVHKIPNIGQRVNTLFCLLYHFQLEGDNTKAAPLLVFLKAMKESEGITPFELIQIKFSEVLQGCFLYNPPGCLESANSGLEMSDQYGIHCFDFKISCYSAWTSIYIQDFLTAGKYLMKIEKHMDKAKPWEISFYHFLKAFEFLVKNDLYRALKHSETALSMFKEMGAFPYTYLCHLINAHVKNKTGDKSNALLHVEEARKYCQSTGNSYIEFICLLSEAQFTFEKGNNNKGNRLLCSAMSIGRKNGYYHHLIWQDTVMSELCAKALDAAIEVEYVQELIKRRNLVPKKSPIDIPLWPWPIKIYTLGNFALVKDGQPVQFSRKAQKKPMEMLKAIIALGGRGIKEEELTDLLWPDSDGDKAHWAFDTTIRRLRKLLGDGKTIHNSDGQVTLDHRRCWVDAWAFERILGDIERDLLEKITRENGEGQNGQVDEKISCLADKAMMLYHGPFLGNGSDKAWAVSHREKLRSKFLRLTGLLGAYFWERDECEQAVICYQKGLEINDLAEDLYRRLMNSYKYLGRPSEAIAVYKRCKEILFANLSIEPSYETKAIYESILDRANNRRTDLL